MISHPATSKRRKLYVGLCLLVIAALALGACGGSGSSGSGKEDFIAKADKICLYSAQELKVAIARQFSSAGGALKSQLIKFTRTTAVPNIERQLQQIRALPQPEDGRATLRRYYSEYAKGIAELKANPELVAKSSVPPAFQRADSLAHAYGIDRCVR